MRKILFWAFALVLLLTCRMPFDGTDVGRLHPVEVLYVTIAEKSYHISTDTGVKGTGHTLEEALDDLHSKATGRIFLETANYLLLSPQVQLEASTFWDHLRPACQVCYCENGRNLKDVARYLESHPSEITLLRWRTGMVNIPHLVITEEGCELDAA